MDYKKSDAPHGVALANEFAKNDNEKWCNESISQWVKNAFWGMDEIVKKEQNL